MIEIEDSKRIFEIRAYRKAALNIGSLQEDVAEVIKSKGDVALLEIPGIGQGLAKKIVEFVKTGKMHKYEEYKKRYPLDFAGLTKIQGLGPKKAFRLYKELGVKNVAGLKKVIQQHKVRGLEGFGEKSESELEKGIAQLESRKGRILLGVSLPEAEAIVRKIRESGLVSKVEIAGSTRRMKETVGDLDVLVTSSKPEKVMDFVTKLDEVESTVMKGPTEDNSYA